MLECPHPKYPTVNVYSAALLDALCCPTDCFNDYEIALVFQFVLLFFMTEDFKTMRWIGGMVEKGFRKMGWFSFVFVALFYAASVILTEVLCLF